MKKNTTKGSKGKPVNWFKQQEEKKAFELDPNLAESKGKGKTTVKRAPAPYKEVDEAPIIQVQMRSKREAEHFEAAYAFAQKMSDAKSSEIMTVHLTMEDELVFNIKQDNAYKMLWESGRLMLLIAFPRNWKTMNIDLEMEEDEDEFESLETDEERFDYLYETGMEIYQG